MLHICLSPAVSALVYLLNFSRSLIAGMLHQAVAVNSGPCQLVHLHCP